MVFKFFTILSLIAVASAGGLPLVQDHHHQAYEPQVYHSVPAQYKFAYDVNDHQTGDNHSHSEERDGDLVHGEYSLIDADGFRRVVQYTVDPHSGFNAVVNRIPLEHVKTVVKQVAPVAYVAPTQTYAKQYAVPQAYHQYH
ncbi:larval cuticle protein A2B-like [Stomoxys calcitrans]|uniref:larval cuticle protein A2B-like n=1 Tax=Stomoxys calcitrans TaxID=35570 RepID=UPI0027E2E0BC|nr:larval cuticle protein A2B-like [Stomoxys calcitrans]